MDLASIISDWGLPALFAGAALEGDTVAMVGGAIAHRGHIPYSASALTVAAGAFLSDQAWFHSARRYRSAPLLRRIADRPVARGLLARLSRRPAVGIVGFRFVPGMRTVGPVVLGLSEVPAALFVTLNLASVLVWGFALTAIGYGAGHVLEMVVGRLPLHHHLGLILLAGALAVALAYGLVRRRERGG